MAMRNSFQSVSKGGDWRGIILMLLLTLISTLSVNIAGRSIAFIFLPLIGICLWPRTESSILSIIAILIFGLLLDLLSGGPLGLWALIFLTVFAVFRPHQRLKPHSFKTAFLLWFAILGFGLVSLYFLGWFAIRNKPELTVLLYQALLAIVFFPAIYGIRHLGRHVFSDSDVRGL